MVDKFAIEVVETGIKSIMEGTQLAIKRKREKMIGNHQDPEAQVDLKEDILKIGKIIIIDLVTTIEKTSVEIIKMEAKGVMKQILKSTKAMKRTLINIANNNKISSNLKGNHIQTILEIQINKRKFKKERKMKM